MSGMRHRLWAIWSLLAVLLIAVYVLGRMEDRAGAGQGHAGEDEPADARWLLPAPLSELGAIEVVHEGSLHRFERDTAGRWFYHGVHADTDPQHGHVTDPALAQKIENALVGFGRTRKERRIPVSEGPEKFGVSTPQMIVLVYAKGQPQPLAQYAIGDRAPDGVSRYVLRVGDKEIVTIADFQIANLVNLIGTAVADTQQPAAGS